MFEIIRQSVDEVFAEFRGSDEESRYEKALEIALRAHDVQFEVQRIIPVHFKNVALRDARDEIDILVWVEEYRKNHFKKVAIVLELKVDATEIDEWQVKRYIRSLSLSLPEAQEVYCCGLLIGFPSAYTISNASKPTEAKPIFREVRLSDDEIGALS